jgi:hypothetical protein
MIESLMGLRAGAWSEPKTRLATSADASGPLATISAVVNRIFIYVLWLASHSPRDLVRFAFGRQFCIAEHLAGRLLDAALDLFDRTLNAIFVYDVILLELIKNRGVMPCEPPIR